MPRLSSLKDRIGAGDVAVDGRATEAVLLAPAACFAPGIEAGYDLAPTIDHLSLAVDAQAAKRIQEADLSPGGVERWRADLVHHRFVEIFIHAFVREFVELSSSRFCSRYLSGIF